MKTLLKTLGKNFQCTATLAIPVAMACYFYPLLLTTITGKLACAAYVALYMFYLNYNQSKKSIVNLQFKPSELYAQDFSNIIANCGVQPNKVNIRYAYTNERIATTTFNTISLDPLLWHQTENDQELEKAKVVLNNFLVPTLPASRSQCLTSTKELLTIQAQDFIFKHEIGHVYHQYSYKKLCVLSLIGGLMTYAGLWVAQITLPVLSIGAITLGLLVASIIDLFLSYASNVLFTAQEERKADFFAAKFSTSDEINAAADFFEKQHGLVACELNTMGILSYLPSVVLTGYPDGKTRAAFLRSLSKCDNQSL